MKASDLRRKMCHILAGLRLAWVMVVASCLCAPAAAGGSAPLPRQFGLPALLDSATGDVTGDGISDLVLLVGIKEEAADLYSWTSWLLIRNGATKASWTSSPGAMSGCYDGGIFLGDFDGDGVSDVLTTLPQGGSGGLVSASVLSFAGGRETVLADQARLSAGPELDLRFAEGFKVRAANAELGCAADLDVSASSDEYLRTGLYDSQGRLLRAAAGAADPYSLIEPLDLDGDGAYELVGHQKLWGLYRADTVGYARSVWSWTRGGPKLVALSFSQRDRRVVMSCGGEQWQGAPAVPEMSELIYRALGNEPFWHVDISEESIRFSLLGEPDLVFPYRPPIRSSAGILYDSRTDTDPPHQIEIVIHEQQCSDTMADATYDYTARVVLDGQDYFGCACRGGAPS